MVSKKYTVWIVLASWTLLSSSALAESNFKASATGYQLLPGDSDAAPVGLSLFLGEHFDAFGDIGIFALMTFKSKELSNYRTAGVVVSPTLFQKDWGSLYFQNRIGFGNYLGAGQVTLGTGLRLEPGSYFHLSAEIFHAAPSDSEKVEKYPTSFAIGLGVHF